ncbi:hypothetical protein HY091_03280 [Candidatus Kaiserbacteria bacterium]|nr:hypothetical protein [Candidatus Kaiserbacteria bacterium]
MNTDTTIPAHDNCFRANSIEVSEGMPVSQAGAEKEYYVDFGHGRQIVVCKEAFEAEEGFVFSASLWENPFRIFGVHVSTDDAFYVLIDTGVKDSPAHSLQGVYVHAGMPEQIERGRVVGSHRFLYRMHPGDEIVVLTEDNTLHGLSAAIDDIKPFDVAPERVDEVVRAIQLNEALFLVALTGDRADAARQAGYHQLISLFEGDVDGGAKAFDALFAANKAGLFGPAVSKRFLKIVQPRILDLVRGYGFVKSENSGLLVWEHQGTTYRVPLERPKQTRKQIEAARQARREARLGTSPKGAVGSKPAPHGKKKKR